MSRYMRTTIRLDDQLLAEAKRYASESGRTLTGLIEDALSGALHFKICTRTV
jgi:Arc/MetJ family transcription regulator